MAVDLERGIASDDANVAAMIDAFGLMIGQLPGATAAQQKGRAIRSPPLVKALKTMGWC